MKQPVFGAVPAGNQVMAVAENVKPPAAQLLRLADPIALAVAVPETPKQAIPAMRIHRLLKFLKVPSCSAVSKSFGRVPYTRLGYKESNPFLATVTRDRSRTINMSATGEIVRCAPIYRRASSLQGLADALNYEPAQAFTSISPGQIHRLPPSLDSAMHFWNLHACTSSWDFNSSLAA